jgi:hypothetical protein
LYPDKFDDRVNALGQPFPNNIPDVLDEDPSDYGWGPNSYRVAYFATGQPQGLSKYKSEATSIANLAGRSAAAMALAARIWKDHLNDPAYSKNCLDAARTLYQLGRENEGFQQGNSCGAPYRYTEETWADDMEWGAAELCRVTGEATYLEDAKRYAKLANTVSWMNLDSAYHYQYYPFINMGYYALYELVEKDFQEILAGYYRNGIDYTFNKALASPYGIGIPAGGEYPVDIHTSVYALTKQEVPGGLVDGPVFASIFNSLQGLLLNHPDEFAAVHNKYEVYHDDMGDYSTNEPTMDGTAGAILMMARWAPDIK